MITKEKTYEKAFEIKKEALLKKQRERNVMLNAAYNSNKMLAEIDMELASIGANLALTALSGDSKAVEAIQNHSQALSAEKQLILNKADVKDIVYDCPLCEDTGYINGRICDCIKKLANEIAAKELSAKMPLGESTFDNFDLNYYSDKQDNARRRMTSIFKLAKEYALNFNPQTSTNLLFLGEPGLGKTHLTLAIVSSVIKKGYLPIYSPAETIFSTIEKEKFQGENLGAYEQMQNCDLLVIDDLGTELVTSFTKSVLYNLINTRILSKKPTIINTNLTLKEIEELYTPRITSRLIGNYNANKFLGNDVRQQKILGK
jgi:DNA replication protein DnaC